ncbi:Proteasome beta-type subunit, conserved site,Nucleophile aminohydrolases, N-terminal,Proteasome [Cinara cedri]|uniref:Proteasome subunit beta n=1 Tax=Cinara cedri TaxID=506608 RepID=A0A5E4MGS9_9HEMI|nr:Proteasome beta-type subunit, conserved site,Nucleophile aminohydrolases, N-terminal,Proteasome [Cinara cedri]
METVIGIKFNDFVLIATDMTAAHSIMVMKDDEDKTYNITDTIVMGVTGEPGDVPRFAEYITQNVKLYRMRNGYDLSVSSIATFTRKTVAEHLRSQSPYQVNFMLGGYDPAAKKSHLYFIDYLGAQVDVPYGAHGYGGMMTITVMDRYYKPDANYQEAYDLLKKCILEVQKRCIINMPKFKVKMSYSGGLLELPMITKDNIDQNVIVNVKE